MGYSHAAYASRHGFPDHRQAVGQGDEMKCSSFLALHSMGDFLGFRNEGIRSAAAPESRGFSDSSVHSIPLNPQQQCAARDPSRRRPARTFHEPAPSTRVMAFRALSSGIPRRRRPSNTSTRRGRRSWSRSTPTRSEGTMRRTELQVLLARCTTLRPGVAAPRKRSGGPRSFCRRAPRSAMPPSLPLFSPPHTQFQKACRDPTETRLVTFRWRRPPRRVIRFPASSSKAPFHPRPLEAKALHFRPFSPTCLSRFRCRRSRGIGG